MTNPGEPTPEQPTAPAEPMTLQELLAQLRMAQNHATSDAALAQAAQLPDQAQKQAYVDAVADLGTTITRLETAQLAEIRQLLEGHSAELQDGIDNLESSLGHLENVNAWAGAINGVLGIITQIVPLV